MLLQQKATNFVKKNCQKSSKSFATLSQAIKMSWTDADELTLDERMEKMIGPVPDSPFPHKKVEIRKLKVVGFKGYDKKLHEEYNVQFKDDYQIGNGRFGKVYRGTTIDKSLTLAFKGFYNLH